MNKLTDFSMKNIAAVMILILLLVVGGTYAATTLKVESMPDISFPVVFVTTSYQAPPKDVMEHVTEPLEKAIAGLEGIKNLNSTSMDNFSQVVVELEQHVKPEDAKQDIESLIANVKLPDRAENPEVRTFGFASEPVYYLSLYADGLNRSELDKLVEDVFVPGFESINGVDHIDTIGDQEATLSIKLDASAISNYGLTPAQVAGLIRASLTSSPAGNVDFNGNTQMIRVKGEFDTIFNLENLKITTPAGDTLLLKQISTIEAINEAKFISRLNHQEAIAIHLFKNKSANVVEFATAANQLIEGWKTTYPHVTFDIILDGAKEINKSIHGMMQEGMLGAVLASLMILLFLRNMRMTMIVLVSIPLSMLITLLFMSWLDISLNIMTLGGMAIAVGRVVDDSIVVIENIYSHLQKVEQRHESVIKLATQQVSKAITSSTITTVAVFGPIGMVSGVVGEVFRPFALTIVCALMSSLLVALTVIPMMAKLMVLNKKKLGLHEQTESRNMTKYRNLLLWSLNHKVKTLLLSGALFILSFVLIAPQLSVAFMPSSDSDKTLLYSINLPRETSLEMTDAKVKEVEKILNNAKDDKGQPIYRVVESLVGYEWSSEQYPYKSGIIAEVNPHVNAKAVMIKHKEQIEFEMPKGSDVFAQVITFGPPESGQEYSYVLKSDDLLYLKQGAEVVKDKMKQFPELLNVKDSLSESKTEVEVQVDQNKARLYGLNTAQVLDTVRSWVSEEQLGEIKFNNITYKTTVELDPEQMSNMEKLGKIQIRTSTGSTVYLNEIAKVKQVEAPVAIGRDNQKQYVTISAKIESVDTGGVSNQVTAALAEIELPSGVTREIKGASDDIQKSFMEMFIAMAASIFIVYLIMVITFGNASAPFAIIFSLPLAAIGGLLGLLLTGEAVSVTSLIGFLMLIGIVVTNAIVLVDRVQQLREQGYTVRDALIESGITRLRPIIMTAGATVIALMPLALGMSEGAIISKGLAIVVIGGLTTSTLLTLVVVPAVYEMNEVIKAKFAKWFKKKSNQSTGEQQAQLVH